MCSSSDLVCKCYKIFPLDGMIILYVFKNCMWQSKVTPASLASSNKTEMTSLQLKVMQCNTTLRVSVGQSAE